MSWTDRQRAMLEAMGLKVWVSPTAAESFLPSSVTERPASAVASSTAAPAHAPSTAAAPSTALRETDSAVAFAESRPAAPPPAPVRTPATAAAPTPAAAPRPMAEVLAKVLPSTVPGDTPQSPAIESGRGLPRGTIATLDWTGLRETVAQCRACTLCESRKHTVFGVGHERAHWMIVGEAPGEQEDEQGEPFVGAAGKLLDSMLRSIGLSRDEGPPERQVYIANTLKCRPPRNRNPDPAELAQCEPYLQRQIELIQPRVIIAMGRFAVQQLLQSQEAIGRLRGRVHRYQGVPLIVTYHPAYLLRNLPEKAKSWEDLCLALSTVETAA
ncbi:uracil-DNA glycosylase [Roseateles amylovorans]|uniref:Type-4 uracil-DNA glycosylase n=1 Tax=Roseateles amylovorans TaxID=2978473 RepID=A0ABY6B1F1_9BURK|nr:uracil-DNA glycosylase [Roseateles amylovorans]UXH79012.1 uracil-DNA glycosylase [Roseateles amylovorans]